MKKLYKAPEIELVQLNLSFATLSDDLVHQSAEAPSYGGSGMGEATEPEIFIDDDIFG